MSSIEYIYEEDLCDSDAQLIAHQCCCSSLVKEGKGLYADIVEKFPYADFYKDRTEDSKPGTVKVFGDKKLKQRLVLAIFGQIHFGGPSKKDTEEMREKWFDEALLKISKINGLKSIAFPSKIGCGLAQGNWEIYRAKIEEFSKKNPHIKISIVSNLPKPESSSDDDSEEEEVLSEDESSEKTDPLGEIKECSDSDESSSEDSESEEKGEFSSERETPKSDEGTQSNISNEMSYENNIDFLKWAWKQMQETPFIDTSYFIDAYKKGGSLGTAICTPIKEWSWKTTGILEYTKSNIPKSYEKFFGDFIENGGFDELDSFLKKEAQVYTIFPEMKDVYKALELCPVHSLKVVVVGQDPYHILGAAMGVAFGHNKGVKLQPSLRNIYKAVEKDGFKVNYENGDITRWCTQGVLFINTALTVRAGEAGSHASKSKSQKGQWDYFTNQLFRFINDSCNHVVVMLWGAKAQEYKDLFSLKKHHIITAPHPAASSYNPSNSDFINEMCFSKTNRKLKTWGYEPIDWNLL